MEQEGVSDVAFRVRAVELMKAGANVSKLSRELGVSREALYRWKRVYEKEGPAGLDLGSVGRPLLGRAKQAYERLDEAAQAQVRVGELERKVGQQALQIDFLARAFKRVKELRPNTAGTGATASTERSGQ
jgi:transposase-like protein